LVALCVLKMKSASTEPAWDDLRVLLAVHRHQSFKRAGDALGLSTSTTARRMEVLEAAMGRVLVVRTSRGTVIDPGALRLVELAESLELGLRAARRHDEELRGTVRLSTGDGFAAPLVPVLAELRRRTPETLIELVSETRLVDVARREADLAIRTARTSSAVVIERRLGSLRFALYASKGFVARRLGATTTLSPRELERLEFIGALGLHEQVPQTKWLLSLGARRFGFRANTDALVHEAARQSQGIAVLAELVGDADPLLQRLEVNEVGPSIPVWLVFHRELRDVPRVRAVAQAVEAAFHAWL
jgi:DNA-binding transcriptional LysR family regulator